MPTEEIAIPDEDEIEGLEDLDESDVATPEVKIDHRDIKFILPNGEAVDEFEAIILGLIKGRVMWPPQIGEDNEPPLCKSGDFKVGRPGEAFPWDQTPFEEGSDHLDCNACPLKEWNSHPTRDIPWCSEVHTFALLTAIYDEDGNPEAWAPALFTLQRSAIKPSRTYLGKFRTERKPTYTVLTTLKLDGKRKGGNSYGVPIFERGAATPKELYPFFSEQYRGLRDFVQKRNASNGASDDEGTEEETAETATPVEHPKAKAKTAPKSTEDEANEAPDTEPDDDEEVPF